MTPHATGGGNSARAARDLTIVLVDGGALAQGRLEEAPDGTILYTMKRRFSDGRHVLRFEPREFVLRLCALVPPRGAHVTRWAGIFLGARARALRAHRAR